LLPEQNGNSEIYVLGTDGSGLTNLTNNPAYDGNPVWSPDGSKIAFESDRNGKRDIFTMNSDGSGLTQLTHDSGNDILRASPDLQNYGVKTSEGWSPDGTHILFSNDRTGQWVLSVMNSDGSGVTQLMQAKDPPAQAALWSPDGKQVAYTLPTANGYMQIVAVNIDGTNRRVIATGDPAKGNEVWLLGRMIAWSQDEQFFYYEYETGDGNWSILKTASDGAQAAQVVASGYALAGGLFGDAWLGTDGVLYYVTIPVGHPIRTGGIERILESAILGSICIMQHIPTRQYHLLFSKLGRLECRFPVCPGGFMFRQGLFGTLYPGFQVGYHQWNCANSNKLE